MTLWLRILKLFRKLWRADRWTVGLLLENGDFRLLENGDKLLLEG